MNKMIIMKKILALLCLCALLLTFLTSCTLPLWFNDWVFGKGSWNQPMSKWVAEGIELYVLNCGPTDTDATRRVDDAFMITDFGDTKMFYDVRIYPECENRYGISISDIHGTSEYLVHSPKNDTSRYPIHNGYLEPISETQFQVALYNCEIKGGGYDIPELMFPKEIIFTRVAENLTEEDIPKIEINQQYEFCPTYRRYSRWVSDDFKMTLSVGSFVSTDKVVKCQVTTDPDVCFCVDFFESNSSAFLTKTTEENLRFRVESLETSISNSSEEWQCEYFENYFLATVIRSEYYETGHIITFTLLPAMTREEAEEESW